MAAGLQSEIWNNNIRSIILLTAYPLIIMAILWACAYAIGMGQNTYTPQYGANGYYYAPTHVVDANLYALNILGEYWPIIVTVIVIWFMVAYWFNASMIRSVSGAKQVTRQQEPELYNLLENLCIAEGMTTPELNIIETPALNAFASGVDERSYTVTVTRGLINTLSKDEMEAVIGHELTHIINRDVRLLMVCVVFTGMVGFMAQMAWRSMRHGLYYGRSDRKGGGVLLILVIALILWVGYMATLFTRFALSRRREFMADAGSVRMTKNPDAMMRALLKISGLDFIPQTTEDVRMMCIENARPFMGLFATHPPIQKRIEAISQLTGTPVPTVSRRPDSPATPPKKESRIRGYNPWNR